MTEQNKSDPKVALAEGRRGLLPASFLRCSRLLGSILCGVDDADVGGCEDDALAMFSGLLVGPLDRLEEALDCYEIRIFELQQRLCVLVLSP